MYDTERIGKIISDIEKYFRDLEELDIKKIEDLEDKKNFYSLSMVLFSAINRTINLGEEVVVANDIGMPSTYREIFRLLAKNKFIDRRLEKRLSNLVFYRNLLSHEYYDLTEKDVFDVSKRIKVVKQFVDIVKDEISKKGCA
ncbi:MAG: DUF86 domain-containing protein [Methanosarcinales archaeon Met12]|nr:MAG: DUF86 domain-containing protein [Methanosarcinales archaeon Met12]